MAKTPTNRIAATVENLMLKRLRAQMTTNARDIGPAVNLAHQSFVDTIKDMISKGISPIQGDGRFPAYKNPTRYPDQMRNRFPAKRRRPVNLFLSGKFMSKLTFKNQPERGAKLRILVGYFDTKSIMKERGHREGTNGQPQRPTIPSSGETWARSLTVKYRQVLINALRKKR